ncbi:MAG: hypothetical protein AAGF31_08790 [Planctomycetota bacterium]
MAIELMKDGISIRSAAATCGVGRETIRRHIQAGEQQAAKNGRMPPLVYDHELDQMVPSERCPQCGAMVLMPCVKCRTFDAAA